VDPVEANDDLILTDAISISVRTYTSIRHLQSAAFFARQASDAEAAWPGIGPNWDEQGLVHVVANATAALYCSVAFLEASVNELYLDAVERERFEVKQQWLKLSDAHPRLFEQLASIWLGLKRDRAPMVEKYRRARLLVADGATEPGRDDVLALVTLRNWLTHAKPETVVVSSTVHDMPTKLRPVVASVNGRFRLNSKWGDASPSLDAVLSADCSAWAVRSSVAFADGFWAQLGVAPPYAHVRPAAY
jgi:hypothetical protein